MLVEWIWAWVWDGGLLTKTSWTAPQKQVAVASFSLDQPSLAKPARGMKGLDLSAVLAAV